MTAAATSNEFIVSLGGLVGRFEFTDAPSAFLADFRRRYDPWCLPASSLVRQNVAIRIALTPRLTIDPSMSWEQREKLATENPVSVFESQCRIEISRRDLSVQLDRATNQEQCSWYGTATCEMGILNFDALFRVVWSVLLPHIGGGLVHACAVQIGQSAVLLPGQSGTGKSTFAAKTPNPDDVLSDEMTPVVPDGRGGWRVFSSPFWGDFKRAGGSLRSWPLRAVVHIEKNDSFLVQRISPANSLSQVMGCLLCFSTQVEIAIRNFNVAIALATSVPAFSAGMRLETKPSELFDALANGVPSFEEPDLHASARELISESRWSLHKHGHHAYRAQGGSMHPHIRNGEAISVETVSIPELQVGNVLLYWAPGPSPEDDRLICHRLVCLQKSAGGKDRFYMKGDTVGHMEEFDNGYGAEVFGLVTAMRATRSSEKASDFGRLSRQSRAREVGRLLVSLGTGPLSRVLGR